MTPTRSSDRPPQLKTRSGVVDRPPPYGSAPATVDRPPRARPTPVAATGATEPRRPPPTPPYDGNGRADRRPPMRPSQPAGPAETSGAPVEPTLLPPVSITAAASGTFYQGQKITGLFTAGEPRNSWIAVPGLGWKKLSSASDGTTAALAILAAHARQTNAMVDLREDGSGAITELYVW